MPSHDLAQRRGYSDGYALEVCLETG